MTLDTLAIPTDDSAPAEAATARGVDPAEQLDATVHCFSVADGGTASGFDSLPAGDDGAADRLAERADDHDPDSVVMGTHGRGGFQRAVVGSVTAGVVRTASRPVLTVRAGTGEPPEDIERGGTE